MEMKMDYRVQIGWWIEAQSRDETHCPSYYAADTETLRTTPGRYPLYMTYMGGYMIPMPQWLLANVPSVRLEGRLYSGFGGNNFASTELKAGEAIDCREMYAVYSVGELADKGQIELLPNWEWLIESRQSGATFNHPNAPRTWDDLRKR
jgi:hypothetical protein